MDEEGNMVNVWNAPHEMFRWLLAVSCPELAVEMHILHGESRRCEWVKERRKGREIYRCWWLSPACLQSAPTPWCWHSAGWLCSQEHPAGSTEGKLPGSWPHQVATSAATCYISCYMPHQLATCHISWLHSVWPLLECSNYWLLECSNYWNVLIIGMF